MSLALTLNKVLMTAIGLSLLVVGIMLLFSRKYVFGAGMCFFGIGSMFWSLTSGFIDMSPKGRVFYRLGVISFLIGFGITIYFLSGFSFK